MPYPTSQQHPHPLLSPTPVNHLKNSACVLDFPPYLCNPAQPFLYRRAEFGLLVMVCFTKLRSSNTHFPAPCFSPLTPSQPCGKAKPSLYSTLSPVLPPDRWAGRRQRARLLAGVRLSARCMHTHTHMLTHVHEHTRTYTHAHTTASALVSPSCQSRTGSPGKAELRPQGLPRPRRGWE